MTASVDVAHLARDLTRSPELTARARLIAAHSSRYLLDRGPDETAPPADLLAVNRRQLKSNERLPLPPPLRHELVAAARKAATSSRSAAAVPDICSTHHPLQTVVRAQSADGPRGAEPLPHRRDKSTGRKDHTARHSPIKVEAVNAAIDSWHQRRRIEQISHQWGGGA
jgi:hypothetical protein